MSAHTSPSNDAAASRRYRSLLEVTESISSHTDISELFSELPAHLRPVVNFDAVAVALHDDEHNLMRLHVFESSLPLQHQPLKGEGGPVSLSPEGVVWQTQQPMLISPVAGETRFPKYIARLRAEKINTLYSIPLTSSGRRLGAIAFGSVREHAYDESELEFLRQVAKQVAVAVDNVLNFEHAASERDRKQLLIEVGQAVVSNLSLSDLFRTVSSCLQRYINHDTASFVLQDQDTGELRVHMLDRAPGGILGEGMVIPMDGTPAGLCIKTRSTILRDRIDFEEFHVPQMRTAYALGLRCGCSVPLIAQGQVLGAINVGSFHEEAFTREDAELLEQIAQPVAVATQNALNFRRAERERDRNQLLLDINNAVVTNLELHDLIRATAKCLRSYFKNDFAGMSLYDDETDQLIVHSLDSAHPDQYLIAGAHFEIEGTLNGLAFRSGQAVIRNRIDATESSWPLAQRFFEEQGLKSACFIPMISGGSTIGVLNLGCRVENAFSEADVELLVHIGGQIAIAVQNSLNFERARKFEQRAARERDRIRLLLEINNAVVSHLDLKELVKTVSASLREVMPHDAAGIALYEPDLNQLREYTNVNYKDVESFRVGDAIPLEGTPAGHVFLTGQPLLVRRPNLTAYPADRYSQHPVAGSPKSACLAPLISHGRKLGIAGVSSTQEEKFTDEDLEFFGQISGQIALAVENSLQYREIEVLKNMLTGEKHYLEEEIKTQYNFAEIVGQSAALREVLRQVETVAPTDSTVLLIGETGTGKELIARAIHNLSARNERTLVKLNCAAIPTGLLESELFGHEKGAFTGAIAPRIGRFELAHKGTLLLDEIGEIPLELQPKLLRVLQEHEFERLGSSRTIKTDARLVAATNCDLAEMVEEKKFRSDLFYRLNVFPIMIPPLRERTGDIPLLVSYFTQKHAGRMNKKIQSIPAQTMEALSSYHWPGNVRELENFVERSVILSRGSELQSPLKELQSSAEVSGDGQSSPTGSKLTTMDEMERAYIEEVLRHTNGSIGGKGGAAEILGMPASTLRGRMKKLGVR